jgi:hypothetical protein
VLSAIRFALSSPPLSLYHKAITSTFTSLSTNTERSIDRNYLAKLFDMRIQSATKLADRACHAETKAHVAKCTAGSFAGSVNNRERAQ